MIPEQFAGFMSYSRYRGYNSKVQLSDKYFAKIIDGNLICTDKECDIDCDGNIVLVTPDGSAVHIGQIPMTEDGSPVRCTFDEKNNLCLRWKCYADCDHKHPYMEEEIVPTKFTKELKLQALFLQLQAQLRIQITNHNRPLFLHFSVSYDSYRKALECRVSSGTKDTYGRYKTNKEAVQEIKFDPQTGFILQPTDRMTLENVLCNFIGRDKVEHILDDFNRNLPEWADELFQKEIERE